MPEPKFTLKRLSDDGYQTLGLLYNPSTTVYHVLELPWKNNQPKISCIPKGTYDVEKRYTDDRGWHFHVLNVPDRDKILMHIGNFFTDVKGCLLPGKGLADINGDGRLDVTGSRPALNALLKMMPAKFKMEII
jgi:hypothetical protein